MKNKLPVIFYNNNGFYELAEFLSGLTYSKLIILVNQKTKIFCLPYFKEHLRVPFYFIEIKDGERYKNIKTVQYIWEELINIGADRQSILINIGGGVITDIGGFAAATFKRGIRFINIPTTVLAMVDAAIGGKTGIDYKGLKNQIGVFQNAIALLVNINFLDTLDKREKLSGLAEIIKYGLIDKPELLDIIQKMDSNGLEFDTGLIKESLAIKQKIVKADPMEKGLRKTLNFGHTWGHALETFYFSKPKKQQLLHGEAVAIGMIIALHLSHQILGLKIEKVAEFSNLIIKFYLSNNKKTLCHLPLLNYSETDFIYELLQHDKKNFDGQVNFILLKDIGKPVLDCQVDYKHITNAIIYYNNINPNYL